MVATRCRPSNGGPGSRGHIRTVGLAAEALGAPEGEAALAGCGEFSAVLLGGRGAANPGLGRRGYAGDLVGWARDRHWLTLRIVSRPEGVKGFVVLPRRWRVERAIGWCLNARRSARDYGGGSYDTITVAVPSERLLAHLADVRDLPLPARLPSARTPDGGRVTVTARIDPAVAPE